MSDTEIILLSEILTELQIIYEGNNIAEVVLLYFELSSFYFQLIVLASVPPSETHFCKSANQ